MYYTKQMLGKMQSFFYIFERNNSSQIPGPVYVCFKFFEIIIRVSCIMLKQRDSMMSWKITGILENYIKISIGKRKLFSFYLASVPFAPTHYRDKKERRWKVKLTFSIFWKTHTAASRYCSIRESVLYFFTKFGPFFLIIFTEHWITGEPPPEHTM